ncbi:trihelix transcription factor ASR3 [Durio zibethinus]|uniref:Trihelix transcription factor ASR3 n=1 Tax=Durio zibethinus TaxID=66656 RepID=A0A6P5XPN4_DURZI|nr:trihelix transcription factor ASR3 [Durio zibethinus]XP_022730119.1 trihelix transcription factor ASR3 [Durio zibethinus]
MEHEDDNPSRLSGIRRTRSLASPYWAAHHLLILVNEIAATEADCSNALSSFQKWKIIVENCNALGVPHSSNQCRRKWNLLLHDYKKIKRWESESGLRDSYWSLDGQRRKQYELPENFEEDLFKAINDVVRLLEDKSGTDRDSDPEAQDDKLGIIADLGPRKQKRKLIPLRSPAEAKSHKRCAVEKLKEIHLAEQPQESPSEEKLQRSEAEERSWRTEAEENPEKCYMDINHMFSMKDEEQSMVARLGENAEQIHAVVEENFNDHRAANVKNVDDSRTDFIRRQGDLLIGCLGDILSTLNQFSELV